MPPFNIFAAGLLECLVGGALPFIVDAELPFKRVIGMTLSVAGLDVGVAVGSAA